MCETAFAVPALGYVMSGSTENASTFLDSIGICHSYSNAAPGVWYSVLGTGKTFHAHTEQGTELDTFISVFSGDCEELKCVSDTEGDVRMKRSYSWPTDQGVTYYLLAQGLLDKVGEFNLVVDEINSPPGTDWSVSHSTPVNDKCSGALGPIPTNGTTWAGSNEGATVDIDVDGSCYGANVTGAGVWFKVIGTGHNLEILAKNVTSFAFSVSIFDGFDCNSLTCVNAAANDEGVLRWDSIHNVPYYVLIHGIGMSKGSFELIVMPTTLESEKQNDTGTPIQLSDNDRCETAMGPLSSSDTRITADTGTATLWEYQQGVCSTSSFADAWDTTQAIGKWYKTQGSDTVIKASIETLSNGNKTFISVFEGSCDNLVCVDSTAHREGVKDVSWDSSSDLLYYIYVHSPKGKSASFELNLAQLAKPFNNECNASLPELIPSGELVRGSTVGATVDSDLGNCHDQPSGPGVWFRVVGNGNFMNLIQNNTFNQTRFSVFSGNRCEELTCLDGFHFDRPVGGAISWTTVQGENYFVHVQSLMGDSGPFEFKLEESPRTTNYTSDVPTAEPDTSGLTASPTGSGATCIEAIGPLEGGRRHEGTFDQAAVSSVGMCGTATNADPGKWFSVLGTGSGIRISTCRSFADGSEIVSEGAVSVSVFKQGCDNLQCYIGSNNTCSTDGTIIWNTEKGESYHVLLTGDAVARAEQYVFMYDHTEWLPPNCKGHSAAFLEQLNILNEFFDVTGNTKNSGPLFDHRGWLRGCDVCNNWAGLECNADSEVTGILLSK